MSAANLSADEVLSSYAYFDEIAEIAGTLPKWKCGDCAESFKMFGI